MTTINDYHAQREARILRYQKQHTGVFRDYTPSELQRECGALGAQAARDIHNARAEALVPKARLFVNAAVKVSGFTTREMVGYCGGSEIGRSSPGTWRIAMLEVCRDHGLPWKSIAEAMGFPDKYRGLQARNRPRYTQANQRHPEYRDMMREIREAAI